jgi:hypothetical protein
MRSSTHLRMVRPHHAPLGDITRPLILLPSTLVRSMLILILVLVLVHMLVLVLILILIPMVLVLAWHLTPRTVVPGRLLVCWRIRILLVGLIGLIRVLVLLMILLLLLLLLVLGLLVCAK